MNVTGFLTSLIQNFFGVPVGTQIRKKKDKGHRQEIQQLMERLVLISSIVEITTDDICIGSTPFYLEIAPEVDIEDPGTQNALEGYKEVIDELNSISKWVAFDLLAFGYSAYKVNMNEEEGKIYILPLLEENLTFFLTAEKKVKVFKGDELLEDVFLFINYSKRDLTQIKDKAIYKINPRPIQLANIGELAASVTRFAPGRQVPPELWAPFAIGDVADAGRRVDAGRAWLTRAGGLTRAGRGV